MYVCVCVCAYIHIYIYVRKRRERDCACPCVRKVYGRETSSINVCKQVSFLVYLTVRLELHELEDYGNEHKCSYIATEAPHIPSLLLFPFPLLYPHRIFIFVPRQCT